MPGPGDYRAVADGIAAAIADGRLRPGDRLPTQRELARRRGIAPSTAARVYRELARRGLTTGEVGRGTFVRAASPAAGPALAEPSGQRVDLELNYPVVPEQSALLAGGLAPLLRPGVLTSATGPVGVAGTAGARLAAAALLARAGWRPEPGQVLFAGSGRQAVAAAVAALVPPGGRLGAEELTYPVLKAIAARLHVTLVPLPVDEQGLVPGAVAAAHRAAPLHALYAQPVLHNPLGVTMPGPRRAELAGVLRALGVPVVEDTIWAFLCGEEDPPPLAALLPELTVLVDSLSKRLAPGLTTGFAVAPPALLPTVAAALRSGGWGPGRFALEAATRWLAEGAVEAVVRAKRADAAARQEIAARELAGFAVRGDARSYSCWWELPRAWRAETFVAAAARHGIAVTPAAAFAVGAARAPGAVRLGLASPPPGTLAAALSRLADLARSGPEDVAPE
ncbi:PLP-dependent aminotransferase family protein [Streptomyces sp. DSM 44917]|uniref:PLP-dependent aminotransferase family protein n=1 Tax=Streptomyces boetiae TaxID=3075541 RepID=A0ABU2LE21_9ACTN|nr:PLP-dependent aminotransferase family protein [Streptomyces sp. DSM 44917]MDT0309523.1 PLP-dependent aminotransferase family protein [Streptomyces sp. DSM 44917]